MATRRERLAGEIGRRFKERREQLGMSQEALARRIGMSRETIRAIENRGTEPELWTTGMLIWALDLDWGEFMALVAEGTRLPEPVTLDQLSLLSAAVA
jgi:DNA-binding XRE family transcriptional regulator